MDSVFVLDIEIMILFFLNNDVSLDGFVYT